tara:strand:+ start:3532 stop:4299 length:768 start_codon:yes stop_codon:yes gene_type:complete
VISIVGDFIIPYSHPLTFKKIIMPKKTNFYWTSSVDDGLKLYQSTYNQKERSYIYKNYLDEPFMKMSEIIVRRFRFRYFDYPERDVIEEVCGFMVSKIHLFNLDKGRSFSYFSLVAKNYLILHNNRNYKNLITHTPYFSVNHQEWLKEQRLVIKREKQSKIIINDVVSSYVDYLKNNRTSIFKKPHQSKLVDGLISLLENRSSIEDLNIRAVKKELRERVGLPQREIHYGLQKTLYPIFNRIRKQIQNKGQVIYE